MVVAVRVRPLSRKEKEATQQKNHEETSHGKRVAVKETEEEETRIGLP